MLGRGSWIRTCFRFSLYFSDLSQFFDICRSHLRVFRTGPNPKKFSTDPRSRVRVAARRSGNHLREAWQTSRSAVSGNRQQRLDYANRTGP